MINKYLDLIKDGKIKSETRRLLLSSESVECLKHPSTYSGANHPEDEFALNGQLLHTLRVTNLAVQILRSANPSRLDCDIVIAASLLHDSPFKFSLETGRTNMNHAVDNTKWFLAVCDLGEEPMYQKVKEDIATCILYHMGRWETSRSELFNQFQMTNLAWTVHLADNLASRKNIKVSIEDTNYLSENLEEFK